MIVLTIEFPHFVNIATGCTALYIPAYMPKTNFSSAWQGVNTIYVVSCSEGNLVLHYLVGQLPTRLTSRAAFASPTKETNVESFREQHPVACLNLSVEVVSKTTSYPTFNTFAE